MGDWKQFGSRYRGPIEDSVNSERPALLAQRMAPVFAAAEPAVVQRGLEPIVRILAAAEQLTGDADRAVVWFRHQPIAGHDGRTAIELVELGQAAAVLAHLQDLRDGSYA